MKTKRGSQMNVHETILKIYKRTQRALNLQLSVTKPLGAEICAKIQQIDYQRAYFKSWGGKKQEEEETVGQASTVQVKQEWNIICAGKPTRLQNTPLLQ